MSQESVDVATRFYEAAGRGDYDLAWEMVDPDIEWETSPNLPDAGIYRGRENVGAFLREQWEVVWGGTPAIDIERVFDCGDDALLFIRVRGRGSGSGIAPDVRIAQPGTGRGDKVTRVKVFPDRPEALAAVGREE